MNELIVIEKREINGKEEQTVNARELHAFLKVGKDFSNWIKDRIRQYNLVEHQDFVSIETFSAPHLEIAKSRPQKMIDYHITITAALVLIAKERGSARDQILNLLLEKAGETDELWRAVMDFEIPESVPDTMYVYAIKNQLTGNIKLGISKDPEARLKQLQVGNDGRLKLVACKVAHNRFADEKLAHRNNRDIFVLGEWFEPSAKLN